MPGTHDISMLLDVFDAAKMGKPFSLPVFDKARDDRANKEHFQVINTPVDVLILEGWCVGISAQKSVDLIQPENDLEAKEDTSGEWRTWVNTALENEYKELFDQLDMLVSLQAPSFDCVLGWRQLQENKMIEKLKSEGKNIERAQSRSELIRFISHYQRLTEHALKVMPLKANYLLQLNEDHQFTELRGCS